MLVNTLTYAGVAAVFLVVVKWYLDDRKIHQLGGRSAIKPSRFFGMFCVIFFVPLNAALKPSKDSARSGKSYNRQKEPTRASYSGITFCDAGLIRPDRTRLNVSRQGNDSSSLWILRTSKRSWRRSLTIMERARLSMTGGMIFSAIVRCLRGVSCGQGGMLTA